MSGYNESAYKQARDSAIALPCPFERALLSRCAGCGKSRKLLLAEREAISCTEQAANDRCLAFHQAVHVNARFALHLDSNQPWPFGKEIRAQCGGILGLNEVLAPADVATEVATDNEADSQEDGPDIASLVSLGLRRYGDFSAFPYSEIMRAVVHYEPRKRRGGK
ncbi:MAG: hypothetical protein B7Y41_08270 [Hydrogenophilales bacterium 28-61-23]|nr:MAG: hypothetical protein B7Y41_08270 [Hydrogenophilales bacterium 28-61-23]